MIKFIDRLKYPYSIIYNKTPLHNPTVPTASTRYTDTNVRMLEKLIIKKI